MLMEHEEAQEMRAVGEEDPDQASALSMGILEDSTQGADAADALQVCLLTAGSALGFVLFGYDTGVVSGASKWAQEDLNMTDFERGAAVAVTPWAAAVATLFAAASNGRFGRKGTMRGCGVLYAVGAFLVAVSNGFITLTCARVVLGLAIGLATTTIPLYVAESAPRAHRGRIVTFNDFAVVFGQVLAGLANIIGEGQGRAWRWTMGVAVVPAVLQLCVLPLLSESPRWLALKGFKEEAKAAFEKMNGKGAGAKVELLEMMLIADHEREREEKGVTCLSRVGALCGMWHDAPLRRAMTVGVFLMVMNQASGINTVMYYSTSILMAAGFDEETAVWGALLCDITQLLGVSVSLYLMDISGRRTLARTSAFAVSPSIFALGMAFWAGQKVMAVVAMAAYLFSFGLGLSGVPWTVNAEIYPLEHRTAAQSQAIFTNWFLNGSIALLFPLFVDSAPEAFFFLFAAVAGFGGWWITTYVPETNGLSLEAIESLFRVPLRTAANGEAAGHNDQRSWDSDDTGL